MNMLELIQELSSPAMGSCQQTSDLGGPDLPKTLAKSGLAQAVSGAPPIQNRSNPVASEILIVQPVDGILAACTAGGDHIDLAATFGPQPKIQGLR